MLKILSEKIGYFTLNIELSANKKLWVFVPVNCLEFTGYFGVIYTDNLATINLATVFYRFY